MNAAKAQEKMLGDFLTRLKNSKSYILWLLRTKLAIFAGGDEYGVRYAREGLPITNASKIVSFISDLYYFAIWIQAAVTAVIMLKHAKNSVFLIAPLYVLGLTLAHMLIEVAQRYHYSMLPMLIIIACMGSMLKTNRDQAQ
jgi:hypothetical protein